MEFVEVKSLPKARINKHRLQDLIDAFVVSGFKVAKINFDTSDYKSPRVCYTCMSAAVRRSRAAVKVVLRGDDVYLVKTI